MELDATAKLACRSDGFRVGYAIPNSDITTGDEQRAICFVNFMIKNGLAAQNTWTAAAAPQEEMCTGRESGTNTRYCAISWLEHRWTIFDVCRIEENTFMSTDHKSVFLGNKHEQR